MRNTGRIIVLNYHLLSDYAHARSGNQQFNVSASVFFRQISAIKEEHIPVVSLDALINGKFAEQFGLILTFDDGYSSDFDIAYPALMELNLPAAFCPLLIT